MRDCFSGLGVCELLLKFDFYLALLSKIKRLSCVMSSWKFMCNYFENEIINCRLKVRWQVLT